MTSEPMDNDSKLQRKVEAYRTYRKCRDYQEYFNTFSFKIAHDYWLRYHKGIGSSNQNDSYFLGWCKANAPKLYEVNKDLIEQLENKVITNETYVKIMTEHLEQSGLLERKTESRPIRAPSKRTICNKHGLIPKSFIRNHLVGDKGG